jgi:hypothetical protein
MAAATTERTFVWAGELAEPPGQRDLRGPRTGHGLGRHTLLTLTYADPDVRAVLVGPGRFTELAPHLPSPVPPGHGA